MINFIRNIDTPILIIGAVLLGAAPFSPQPHLVEKLGMLFHGNLTRSIDIFDLLFHSVPIILLIIKLVDQQKQKRSPQ